jgi:hypothetical protein
VGVLVLQFEEIFLSASQTVPRLDKHIAVKRRRPYALNHLQTQALPSLWPLKQVDLARKSLCIVEFKQDLGARLAQLEIYVLSRFRH